MRKNPDDMKLIMSEKLSYVVDAIDSISPKLYLLQTAYYNNQRIISSMGAGNNRTPPKKVVDISQPTFAHGPIRSQAFALHEHLQGH